MSNSLKGELSESQLKQIFSCKSHEYYFAYGSNLNDDQFLSRCSNPEKIGVASLTGHRIGFFGHSKIWDGGVETVVPAAGSVVWGVVYRLNFFERDRLDAWQDVRLDGTGAYFHYPSLVTDVSGGTHEVVFYKKNILGEPMRPSQEYLNYIIRGAIMHELPTEYILELRDISAKPAAYPVPKRSKFNPEVLIATDCSQCDG